MKIALFFLVYAARFGCLSFVIAIGTIGNIIRFISARKATTQESRFYP